MGRQPGEKVVVITGASGGIGRATARAFASRGDRVALLARGTRGLSVTAAEIEGAGGTCMTVSVDVADREALETAAAQVEDRLGQIDVWVDVAFTSVFARFIFDSRSHRRSAQPWASQHHEALAVVAGLALGTRYARRRTTLMRMVMGTPPKGEAQGRPAPR